MKATHFVIPLSILLLAVGGSVFFYGCQKIERSGSSVGDDVIMIGYGVPAIATVFSALAVFAVRSGSWLSRFLPVAALLVSAASFGFWAWLHLSGIVIPYSATLKQ
jgi:hypothetical protein